MFLKMGKHICHHYMLLQFADDRGERHRSVISWVMLRALLVNRCNAPSLRDVASVLQAGELDPSIHGGHLGLLPCEVGVSPKVSGYQEP